MGWVSPNSQLLSPISHLPGGQGVFESLTAKLDGIFSRLRGRGKLTEANIQEAMREIRLALLEADVHFQVVRDFVQRVREQALGQEVMRSLSPVQQVAKIVRD